MANPVLNSKTFSAPSVATGAETMTIEGTANKTGLLLLICLATSSWIWTQTYHAIDPSGAWPWVIGGAFGGLVVGIATSVKPGWAPITAPLYAALEGLFLGAISAQYAAAYPGILVQAVSLTFATLLVMLLLYRSGAIRVTPRFQKVMLVAMLAIGLYYVATIMLGLFGVDTSYFNAGGPLGITLSVVIVGVAALTLLLDFDMIAKGVEQGAPKAMEWYGAFGLMVGLVWLYLEILRLLGKINRR
ncbi:MAG TPA: Bax inhibitor-1/YccA family protein [Gemmatimonadales bacterium]|jgi:uncharacterized YccA/Bax inhibitor family protein|nr:Bax inhibitor-1/YccA family protein [Gemmatimonadales bacterium]